jgi:hypothetical protein
VSPTYAVPAASFTLRLLFSLFYTPARSSTHDFRRHRQASRGAHDASLGCAQSDWSRLYANSTLRLSDIQVGHSWHAQCRCNATANGLGLGLLDLPRHLLPSTSNSCVKLTTIRSCSDPYRATLQPRSFPRYFLDSGKVTFVLQYNSHGGTQNTGLDTWSPVLKSSDDPQQCV